MSLYQPHLRPLHKVRRKQRKKKTSPCDFEQWPHLQTQRLKVELHEGDEVAVSGLVQPARMDESLSTYLPLVATADASSVVLRCRDTQQKYESSIFNSVSLGQWESARASFKCLALSGEASARENAKELLKILILEAAKFWLAPIYS